MQVPGRSMDLSQKVFGSFFGAKFRFQAEAAATAPAAVGKSEAAAPAEATSGPEASTELQPKPPSAPKPSGSFSWMRSFGWGKSSSGKEVKDGESWDDCHQKSCKNFPGWSGNPWIPAFCSAGCLSNLLGSGQSLTRIRCLSADTRRMAADAVDVLCKKSVSWAAAQVFAVRSTRMVAMRESFQFFQKDNEGLW